MSIRHAVIVLCALGGIRFTTAGYMDVQEVEIEYFDPEYVDGNNIVCNIIERGIGKNALFINATLLKSPPVETYGRYRVLGEAMGKYVVPTGIDMTGVLCTLFPEVEEKIREHAASFHADDDAIVCPPIPGTYYNEYFVPDSRGLPEDIPEGKYLGRTEIYSSPDKPLAILNIYTEVQNV